MKVFRVTGEIKKPNLKTAFQQELVAVKAEHALEKVCAELGSRHRVKRVHIKVTSVEEVPPEQITNPSLKKLAAEAEQIGK